MTDKSTSKKPQTNANKMSEDKRIDKTHKEKAVKINDEAEEFGGQDGPEPTRYGDWEKGGRCSDF